MLVDDRRLRALREEVGDDGYDEVVALFLAESDEVMDRLAGSSEGGVPVAELHFLKGIALNLAFDALAALCQKGERGEGFDPAALRRVYDETRLEMEGLGV